MGQEDVAVLDEGVNIPFPVVDLRQIADPIPTILSAPEFAETIRFFETTPAAGRTLISPTGQALMYSVICNQRPDNLVEIGSYKAGTTETLARTIQRTGYGTLHTGSPYDAARFLPIYHSWPVRLRTPCRYYQVDSMTLFMRLDSQKIQPDVVVIDGDHDYEFAMFDVLAAARRISRGGFIFVNGVSQAGPHLAVTDFLRLHPEWHHCGVPAPAAADNDMRALDRSRSRVPGADFYVLRAPYEYFVAARPETRGEIEWPEPVARGIRLSLADMPNRGTLFAQCVLRGFSDAKITEVMTEAKLPIDGETGTIDLAFPEPLTTDSGMTRYLVEPCLAWSGSSPLKLLREVELF